MENPKVSVIMSIYNTNSKVLKKAIDSILKQTYSNFEFIIIDDASENDYSEFISKFEDKRIKFHRNKINKGLTVNLNIAIDMAKGEYIARMDADDVSMEDRFKKQVSYLDNNPNIGVLGTSAITVGNRIKVLNKKYRNHEIIKSRLIVDSALVHPTVMIRSELLKDNKYDENCVTAQDYELWSRLIWKTEFANLKDILLKYRVHKEQISVKRSTEQTKTANIARTRMIGKIKKDITEEQLSLFMRNIDSEEELLEVRNLCNDLLSQNSIKKVYSHEELVTVLSEYLDLAHYIYTKKTKKFPLSDVKLSPVHRTNKYSFYKYLGPLIGLVLN